MVLIWIGLFETVGPNYIENRCLEQNYVAFIA